MGDTNHAWETFIAKGYGKQMIFKKKTFLYHQGEIGNGFYYLKKGIVKISLLSKEGSERDIDYVTPGNLLGEQGFNNGPYFTTATITVPSTLYFFSKLEFDRLCGEIPEAANIFMDSLINKIRLLADATTILNAPAEYRLAHFLYKLYKQENEPSLSINQVALARFIGTSRITVYKILNEWKDEGLIEHHKGNLHLLDVNKLKSIFESAIHHPIS
ncbi:Crp/Fnr family transcriptional regulator [Sporosarcina soli]|uniref:Crp/Fnr family transcriptional regulator n=1 Tax=Sporosarcina soli TaxID=334736 RepID=A0ABW0TMZ5_9BACL